jgi:hypothetical protein
MDWDVRVPIRGDDRGSSGASVTSLRLEREGPYTDVSDVEGSTKRVGSWAPCLVG